MTLYCGMDLHSNNTYTVVLDDTDQALFDRRLPNRLDVILRTLQPFRDEIAGVAVESTFNWYWLVDGLMDAGYRAHLTNTNAVHQYDGLKFSDDRHDARWLAHLLRLGILPTGYIYPKQERPVRDLLRKRTKLVRQRTANLLSLQNLFVRNTGQMVRGSDLQRLTLGEIRHWIPQPHLVLAMDATLEVIATMDAQILRLEKEVLGQAKLKPSFRVLRTIPGVGQTLALTIMYETGEIGRFPTVGDYVSYCRCVQSRRNTNRKKKGQGNRRNGNPYLAWAFSEAASFAKRFQPAARRFFDRRLAQKGYASAFNALAHKLARASYFMIRDQTAYDPTRLFR